MQEWLIWVGIAAIAIVYIAFIWGRNFWGIANRTAQTVLAFVVWWMALNAYADTQNREPVMKDWLPIVIMLAVLALGFLITGRKATRRSFITGKRIGLPVSANEGAIEDWDGGYVYVIGNKAFPELVKIGMTNQKDYQDRIDQLYQTGTPYPFHIYFVIATSNAYKLEQEMHDIFRDRRVNRNREFFEVTPQEVYKKIPHVGNPVIVEKHI